MEKNKKIIKLCYLQIAFYVVFLTSLLLHFKRGLDHRAFALLIILTLLGCASALTLTDYLKSLIRRSGFDVAGVHDKKSLEEKLLQLQNADDTLDVGVMMFDMNNLKMINDTYGHEEGDVFIQTFASYLTRILTEDSFLARFGGDEFVIYMRNIESKEIASARVKNLIENAYLHAQSITPIQIYMDKGDLMVADTGHGLTNAELGLLTQRFWRKSSQNAGHGLGLSLVKLLLEKHGFSMQFLHNQPQGLKIRIYSSISD